MIVHPLPLLLALIAFASIACGWEPHQRCNGKTIADNESFELLKGQFPYCFIFAVFDKHEVEIEDQIPYLSVALWSTLNVTIDAPFFIIYNYDRHGYPEYYFGCTTDNCDKSMQNNVKNATFLRENGVSAGFCSGELLLRTAYKEDASTVLIAPTQRYCYCTRIYYSGKNFNPSRPFLECGEPRIKDQVNRKQKLGLQMVCIGDNCDSNVTATDLFNKFEIDFRICNSTYYLRDGLVKWINGDTFYRQSLFSQKDSVLHCVVRFEGVYDISVSKEVNWTMSRQDRVVSLSKSNPVQCVEADFMVFDYYCAEDNCDTNVTMSDFLQKCLDEPNSSRKSVESAAVKTLSSLLGFAVTMSAFWFLN